VIPQLIERDVCPGCSSGSFRVLIKIPYDHESVQNFLRNHYHRPPDTGPLSGWNYELLRCETCRLAFQRYVPGAMLLQDIYDRWISTKGIERDQADRTLDQSAELAQEVHFLISESGLRPGSLQVLDFGMGWSKWLKMARAFGCQVSGTDLSVERQRYARSVGIEVLDWGDIPKRRFHFINAEQVFEHLVDPGGVLGHLAAALADNGVLRISVPNARSTLRLLERNKAFGALSPWQIMSIQPLEHINSFEPATLERFGRLAGLEAFRPNLWLIYNSSSNWFSPRKAAKALLRPVYRHVWPKTTLVFFRKPPRMH
jgi:SAM-dependent methyltransferase